MSKGALLLLYTLMIPFFLAVNVFWGGYVTSTLWGWFVVPMGSPAITYLQAAGLSAVVGAFMGGRGLYRGKPDHDDMKEFWRMFGHAVGNSALLPAYLLMVGYVIHQYTS